MRKLQKRPKKGERESPKEETPKGRVVTLEQDLERVQWPRALESACAVHSCTRSHQAPTDFQIISKLDLAP